jgi:hypothetical protein
MQTMIDRAKAIKDRNAALCEQEGSGFHDEDKREKGRPCSPQNRGLPAINTHVVAFQGRWEHTFTGEDATRVHMALKDFAEANEEALTTGRTDPTFQSAVLAAKEYTERGIVNGNLVVRNGQWNDVAQALASVNIGITVAGEKAPIRYDAKRPS